MRYAYRPSCPYPALFGFQHRARAYVEAAARGPRRLDAICFTEHRLFPADPELDLRYAELTEQFGVKVFKGIEADTNLGHLLLFGVTREVLRRFDLSSRMLKSEG